MGPEVVAAGIGGMASLLGGLLGLQAQAKQRKLQALQSGVEGQLQAQLGASKTRQEGTTSAFNQLMANYANYLR